ncbi:hypothetical protein ZHAS_00020082 [Anopheles sinensis]|uniref:Uncharacterized protein n=1 Tax=Anopheles sinensis TaxID=74873 RepID=A0A084WNX5_ANOSI|nr:hypothetical protein ZHAS_00020082 [Anopheles sinensis]
MCTDPEEPTEPVIPDPKTIPDRRVTEGWAELYEKETRKAITLSPGFVNQMNQTESKHDRTDRIRLDNIHPVGGK